MKSSTPPCHFVPPATTEDSNHKQQTVISLTLNRQTITHAELGLPRSDLELKRLGFYYMKFIYVFKGGITMKK